ncbi:MAG TPA: DoxX family protein [Propionibacteriaceae bacterium]|jgi:putative oxidoreductase
MAQFLQVVRDLVLLVARVGLGGILIAHGWRRWQQQGIQQQIDYVSQFGTPYPSVVAWGAILLELVGGIFLIVGALTPLVALAVLAEQVLIVCYTSWYKGPYLQNVQGAYQGGYEYTVTLGLLALVFLVFGAGRASIDRLFRRVPADEGEPVNDRAYA